MSRIRHTRHAGLAVKRPDSRSGNTLRLWLTLDGLQASMRRCRQFDLDGVARRHVAAREHDAHDARLADKGAVRIAIEHGGHESLLKAIDLDARIAQPGDLDHGAGTDVQPRAGRQRQQVDAARGDVLAELAGRHAEACGAQLLEQFGVDEMNLTQVRAGRVARNPRAMLDGDAGVRVAFDAESGGEADAQARWLAEVVAAIARNSDDSRAHGRPRTAASSAGN